MDALRRQCLLAVYALLAFSLVACASDHASPEAQAARKAAAQELLVPGQIITGGWRAAGVDVNGFPLPGGMQGYAALVFPSALAARGADIYIADSGAGKLYRFDAGTQSVNIMKDCGTFVNPVPCTDIPVVPWTRIQVGSDQSLYVLSADKRSILHYARGGQKLPTLNDPPALTTTVDDFVVNGPLGRIVASDSLNQRLVMFNPAGGPAWPMGHAGEGKFTSLGGLAGAGGTVYAIDSTCVCVVSMDDSGRVLAHIGQGKLAQPQMLAVDRYGHIFVSDAVDRTLKVFLRGDLIASYTTQKLRLTEISALAVDGNTLYVADGPSSRVLSFRIQKIESRTED